MYIYIYCHIVYIYIVYIYICVHHFHLYLTDTLTIPTTSVQPRDISSSPAMMEALRSDGVKRQVGKLTSSWTSGPEASKF